MGVFRNGVGGTSSTHMDRVWLQQKRVKEAIRLPKPRRNIIY